MTDNNDLLVQKRKEQEQASLLDKQMQFLNRQRAMQNEMRDLDVLKAMTMQGQQQPPFNMATMQHI